MILRELNVLVPDVSSKLLRNLTGLIVEAVLAGIGFVLIVPLLRAFLSDNQQAAWGWLICMSAVLIVYAALRYRMQIEGYRTAISLGDALFQRLGDHVIRLPLGWFGPKRVGELGQVAGQGVMDVMTLPAHLLRPIVSAVVTPITVICCMALFDWRLAFASGISIPVLLLLHRQIGRRVTETDQETTEAAIELENRLAEFALAQPALRLARSQIWLRQALDGRRNAARKQLKRIAPGFVSFVLVIQIGFTLALGLGTYLVLGGNISASELIALLLLLVRYVEPMIAAADLSGAVKISRNSLARMQAIFDVDELPEPATPAYPVRTEISVRNVSFSYDDKLVLSDVNFSVPANSFTAIVGPSGSGKTTLLRLVHRFWDVSSGNISIGGMDLRAIGTDCLPGLISAVFQEARLVGGSIEDNIRLGRREATRAELLKAVRQANVDELLTRLPSGLATRIGDGGARLSQGERQRIAIARALLKDAPILLLDECTSALDGLNRTLITRMLRDVSETRTIVAVTHDMQVAAAADQILFLRDGGISEAGSHRELLALQGAYASYYRRRQGSADWTLSG
ncbi:MAG: ABC transporter ATP-binding protein [Pseudomonadota bacterium]